MKSTGMVRKMDPMGRVVLPVEMRHMLGIQEKDLMEFFIEGNTMLLQKYEPGCMFCGETRGVRVVCEKKMCPKCLDAIKQAT